MKWDTGRGEAWQFVGAGDASPKSPVRTNWQARLCCTCQCHWQTPNSLDEIRIRCIMEVGLNLQCTPTILHAVLQHRWFETIQYILHNAQTMINKQAVLSQRWPRARYISRSWAVAEIWYGHRIENSAIRSAVPENATLEQNMSQEGLQPNISKMAGGRRSGPKDNKRNGLWPEAVLRGGQGVGTAPARTLAPLWPP